MTEQVASNPEPRPAHPVRREAQAIELRDRWERVHEGIVTYVGDPRGVPDEYRSGSLLVEKEGVGRYVHRPLLVLWRYLDADD